MRDQHLTMADLTMADNRFNDNEIEHVLYRLNETFKAKLNHAPNAKRNPFIKIGLSLTNALIEVWQQIERST